MDLVSGSQAAENRDGRFHGGFVDLNGLETPLECRVLADRLAILIGFGSTPSDMFSCWRERRRTCCRTHELQSSCEGRLDHLPSVYTPLGLAEIEESVCQKSVMSDSLIIINGFTHGLRR